MLQRLLSAFVALAIVLPILFLGGVVGVQLLVGAVLLVVLYEFGPVASPDKPKRAFGVMAVVGGALYALMSWAPPDGQLAVATVLGVGFLLSWAMFAHEDPVEGAVAGAITALAVPYLALAMAFVGWVRALEPDGLTWIFYVLIMTWAADTGAYFAGRFLGKRKLLERISPKKTWEGVWGGVALSIVISVGWMTVYPLMPMVHAAILGAVLAGCGVVGDLVESMFKRARGIKDSGGIMPGHGGLFDRVDSLLFTMPMAWAYATLFGLA
jgi:phosphatidate cytidylyltransferase